MAKYDGEQMERIAPNLPENNKEIILITYDECIFYSNDGKRGVWAKSSEFPLRKKEMDDQLWLVSSYAKKLVNLN